MNEALPDKVADKTKSRRRRTFIYLWVLIALLILFVTATYTWFALSRTPKVYDMAMYINADSGLELALSYDASDGDWGQRLDFVDLVSEEYPLRPITWSSANGRFMTVRYGFDGRSLGEYIGLNDIVNANQSGSEGYYVRGVFYARTKMPCTVSLAEAVELNDGVNGSGTYVIGKPIWNADELRHDDGGDGAETAIRLGFRVTHVDPKTGNNLSEPEFFIYEPSCDTSVSGEFGYYPTPSIDGTETLVDSRHLILQAASIWEEADPVQRDVTVKTLGGFYKNNRLFSIERDEVCRIELYVWLEGQDPDCISRIDEAQIFANIQFHADYGGHTGIEDIPQESSGNEASD